MRSWRFEVAFLLFTMVGVPLFAMEDSKSYEQLVSKYLISFREYLQAKLNNEPTAPAKLKVFNDSYSEFIQILKPGNSSGKEVPESIKQQKASDDFSSVFDEIPLDSQKEEPKAPDTATETGQIGEK